MLPRVIFRTRDQKILDTCDVVVDVGGVYDPERHRYDHHQRYCMLSIGVDLASVITVVIGLRAGLGHNLWLSGSLRLGDSFQ